MRILQFTIGRNKMILSEMPDKFIWRKMFPHLTKLANSFGLRQKDINFSYMEYISWNRTENETPYDKESSLMIEHAFKSALKGEKRLNAFYLYKYTQENGFELLRKPL